MRRGRAIALATITLAALAAVIGCLSSSVILRTVVVSPLIFFLPGHAIMRIIDAQSSKLEHIVLSATLSVALTVLGGVVLNALSAFSVFGWVGLLATTTIIASAVSTARFALGAEEQVSPSDRPRFVYWGMYAAAVAIGLSAILVARDGAEQQRQYSFTELWMVAGSASSGNLATLGIRNAEDSTTTYEIALFADGANVGRRSGILLRPSETWTELLPLNGNLARAGRVEARLFRSTEPETIYRKVWLSNARNAVSSMKEFK